MKAHGTTDSEPLLRLPERLLSQMAGLHQKKQREASGLCLLEGARLVTDALASGVELSYVVMSDDMLEEQAGWRDRCLAAGIPLYSASAKQFHRLADTVQPQGMAAAAVIPHCSNEAAAELCDRSAIVVALHDVADPGNLGAIVRSMDWFGSTLLLLSRNSVDPWNPKVVRSAMGSMFRVRIHRYDSIESLLRFAEVHGRTIVAAVADGGSPLRAIAAVSRPLLLFGSEAHGLPGELLDAVHTRATIAGSGGAESLNLAMSASIFLYELHTSGVSA